MLNWIKSKTKRKNYTPWCSTCSTWINGAISNINHCKNCSRNCNCIWCLDNLEGLNNGLKLSKRSMTKLEGVQPKLVAVVQRAIEITNVDFGVIQGLRTVEEQRELVAKGASQTMKSKHITGEAVDVMAYIGSSGSWEMTLYDDIADAFKLAAIEEDVQIRWGAAWQVTDLREWDGTMQDAMDEYIDLRRSS